MSVQIKWRGDSTAAHTGFVGADREITIDMDKRTLVVHDGETAGGFPLAREDLSNVSAATIKVRGAVLSADMVGTVVAAPLDTLTGHLKCDGATVSRTIYAALFAKIGITFGAGDDETTFKLPDYRGYFLRGLGGASAANYQTAQADQFQGHSHSSEVRQDVYGSGNGAALYGTSGSDEGMRKNGPDLKVLEPATYGSYGNVRTGTETRPMNYAVNYFIRY